MNEMMSLSMAVMSVRDGQFLSGQPTSFIAVGYSAVSIFKAWGSFVGLSIVGRKGILHCLADSMVIFFQRSIIFGFFGSFTVRSKITGVIRSMPSSVHFAMSQSKRSPLAMLVAMMILFVGLMKV